MTSITLFGLEGKAIVRQIGEGEELMVGDGCG
jgi:hypothetical protein